MLGWSVIYIESSSMKGKILKYWTFVKSMNDEITQIKFPQIARLYQQL